MSNFKIGGGVCFADQYGIIVDVDYRTHGANVVWQNGERSGWFFFDELVSVTAPSVDLPKYVIVQGKAQDVVAEVEQYLKQGYKLQGGVSMHQDWFAQAMILGD